MAAVTVSPSIVWPAIHATSSAAPIRQHRPSLSTSTETIASGGRLVDDDDAIPGTAVQPSHHLTKPVSNIPLTGAIHSPCAVRKRHSRCAAQRSACGMAHVQLLAAE